MKTPFLITILAAILSCQVVHAELITTAGTHSFRNGEVLVSVAGTRPDELNFTMTFDLPSFRGQTGTGKGSPMKVAPTGWAVQFVAPNELWIFDGFGKITLYERTINPSGFKGRDSNNDPSLLKNAPEELRLFIAKSASSKCVPMKPGEVKVWVSANDRGKHLYRRWAVDLKTVIEERIVTNQDSSVRGRVITTYVSGKPSTALAYKGVTEPWFIEQWAWRDERGYSVERRSIEGEVIALVIFPSNEGELVKSLDGDGNEISNERYQELADEVADILF